MEYQLGNYVRSNGKILTSSDGFKYVKYKVKGNHAYLRCVLSKKGCMGTSKLDIERDLIYPNSIHDHPIQAYNSEIYELKNHCKKIARSSQNSLRKIFNDETLLLVKSHSTNVNRQCTAQGESHNLWYHSMLLNFWKCYQDPSLQPITNLLFLLVSKLQLYSTLNPWLMHYLKLTAYNLMGHSTLCHPNSISCGQFCQHRQILYPSNTLPYDVQKSGALHCHCAKNLDLFH